MFHAEKLVMERSTRGTLGSGREVKAKLLKLYGFWQDQAADPSQIIYSTISPKHHGLG